MFAKLYKLKSLPPERNSAFHFQGVSVLPNHAEDLQRVCA